VTLSSLAGFVTLPEEDRATVIGNVDKKMVKIARVVPEISSRTDRQKDRHTDRDTHHNTSQPLNAFYVDIKPR